MCTGSRSPGARIPARLLGVVVEDGRPTSPAGWATCGGVSAGSVSPCCLGCTGSGSRRAYSPRPDLGQVTGLRRAASVVQAGVHTLYKVLPGRRTEALTSSLRGEGEVRVLPGGSLSAPAGVWSDVPTSILAGVSAGGGAGMWASDVRSGGSPPSVRAGVSTSMSSTCTGSCMWTSRSSRCCGR